MKVHKKIIVISMVISLIFGVALWCFIFFIFDEYHGYVSMASRRCMLFSVPLIYLSSVIYSSSSEVEKLDSVYFYTKGVISFVLIDMAIILWAGIPSVYLIQ